MSRNGKVIVAMSGGVDSSVAACLLKDAGYECVGVFMRVGAHPAAEEPCATACAATAPRSDAATAGTALPQAPRRLRHGCCSATDALDARAIAGKLEIPFYALNFERDFDRIIGYFIDEYRHARTPNPCVRCNIELKFGKLLRYADLVGAEFVATGHYARTTRGSEETSNGESESAPGGVAAFSRSRVPTRLARAANRAKDQSYVLFGIRREDLPRCLFPLGDVADKADVRRLAAELGLRVHDKPDSQEICFVPDNDYRRLLARRSPESLRAGEFRDAAGNVIGRHEGVAAYTIGQRRGLGLALGEPVYVTGLNAATNTVTIGTKEELLHAGLVADAINWHCEPPAAGTELRASVKIRHTHEPAAATVRIGQDGTIEARFDEPQLAVTPGQALVMYEGDFVMGGGWIRAHCQ
jgi:tRNA-specific 2-thiouridylase